MVGFRSTTPLLTGNTQVAAMGLPSIPSVNPGFRMGNTNMPLPGLGFRAGPSVGGGITGTFGGGIDPNIFANYTPSYIPPPPPPPPAPRRRSGGNGGGRDDNWGGGKEGFDGGRNERGPERQGFDGRANERGPDNGGGGSGGSSSSGGGDHGGGQSARGVAQGGQIPPVYAANGIGLSEEEKKRQEEQATLGNAAKATAEEEATFKDIVDSISRGLGFASLLGSKTAGKLSYPVAALNFGTSVVQGTVEEDYIDPAKENFKKYIYNPFNKYIYDPIFGDEMIDPASYNRIDYSGYTGNTEGRSEDTPIYGAIPGDYSPPETSGITKDYTSTSTGPAFDYSPGNINPSTGHPITNYGAIPGNYSPPSVNLSKYDTPNPYMDNLKTAFEDFDASFKAEQEAKQKAIEDAAKASANAAYGGSTWSDDGGGGWGSASTTGGAGSGDTGDVSRGSWGGGSPGSGDIGDVSRGTW